MEGENNWMPLKFETVNTVANLTFGKGMACYRTKPSPRQINVPKAYSAYGCTLFPFLALLPAKIGHAAVGGTLVR